MAVLIKIWGYLGVRFVKLIIVLFVMVLGVVIAVTNPGNVVLNYGIGSLELPLSLVLVGAISVGAIIGSIVAIGILMRLKRENAKLQRKAYSDAVRVSNLSALPLKEQ